MAVKRQGSTINYKAKPVIQIGTEPGAITEALISSLANYDIFLGIPYLNHHQGVIDGKNTTIMLPKTGYLLQCQKGIQVRFSPAAIPENLSHFIQEFPEVFLLQR
jgi:hypothetical protein